MNLKSKLEYIVNLHKKNSDSLGFIPKPYLEKIKFFLNMKVDLRVVFV
jgi:hypothetical protein